MKTALLPKSPPFNSCKHCRINHLCLPGHIELSSPDIKGLYQFRARILKPGEHLCYQGQINDHVYALRSGCLKSYISRVDGEEFVMDFHYPPEIFGWEAIDPKQGALSIVALDHCNICEIPLVKLEKLISATPSLVKQLMQLCSQKSQNQNMALLRTTAEQRVANFIWQLSLRFKRLGYPHDLCKLDMAHQDIANYLRIAPETISRTLKQLQHDNILKAQRGHVQIIDAKRLKELAQQLNYER